MPEDFVVGQREGDSPSEVLKAQVKAKIVETLGRATVEQAEAPPPSDWEVWALGPFQSPELAPGRIIKLGQKAYIVTIVWLNQFMNSNEAGHASKIQLNYFTSNTQTMQPVGDMDHSSCFAPDAAAAGPFGAFYVTVWEFEPTEAACILETNICARVCNCDGEVVPGTAAFVRWIANLDFDSFFPPVFYQFDHPIRYLVYADDTSCECS